MKNNNITKELSDIARDFQLSQSKCNEIYISIGKKYFELNREKPDEDYAAMFAELEEQLKRQDNMEARRKFLNGIVVCTNCKSDNSIDLSFCATCGTRLPHKSTVSNDGNIRCTNCGNVLKPGQVFCGNCGTKAPEVKQPVAEESAATVEVVNTNVICSGCQTEITNPAAVFCPNCGNKVR